MAIGYTKCDPKVTARVERIVQDFHPELLEAEVDVTCLFADSDKKADGKPKSPAVKGPGGYPAYAVVRVIPVKQRADGRADAEIVIDHYHWLDLDETERDALIDHELQHLAVVRDKKTKVILSDDQGRPRLKLRLHDWQIGGFQVIARRYAEKAIETQQARIFYDVWGQYLFPFAAAAAEGKAPEIKSVGTVMAA